MEIIGHRGAKGLLFENTAASFEKALEFPIDMIEFDVLPDKNDQLWVIHDNHLKRLTGKSDKLNTLSSSEVESTRLTNGDIIPSFTEIWKHYNQLVPLNIELKEAHTHQLLLNQIEKNALNGFKKQHVVSSFYHENLIHLNKLLPEITLAPLAMQFTPHLITVCQQLNTQRLHLYHGYITPEIMDALRLYNIDVYAYTVNSQKDYRNMIKLGVKGIFTDFPNKWTT